MTISSQQLYWGNPIRCDAKKRQSSARFLWGGWGTERVILEYLRANYARKECSSVQGEQIGQKIVILNLLFCLIVPTMAYLIEMTTFPKQTAPCFIHQKHFASY